MLDFRPDAAREIELLHHSLDPHGADGVRIHKLHRARPTRRERLRSLAPLVAASEVRDLSADRRDDRAVECFAERPDRILAEDRSHREQLARLHAETVHPPCALTRVDHTAIARERHRPDVVAHRHPALDGSGLGVGDQHLPRIGADRHAHFVGRKRDRAREIRVEMEACDARRRPALRHFERRDRAVAEHSVGAADAIPRNSAERHARSETRELGLASREPQHACLPRCEQQQAVAIGRGSDPAQRHADRADAADFAVG